MDPYEVFTDLIKVFDTVNKKTSWKIVKKLRYSDKFISVLRGSHGTRKESVNINGKQKAITVPNLLYFIMIFLMTFKGCPYGVYIKY